MTNQALDKEQTLGIVENEITNKNMVSHAHPKVLQLKHFVESITWTKIIK